MITSIGIHSVGFRQFTQCVEINLFRSLSEKMAIKFFNKILQAATLAIAGYEVGSKTDSGGVVKDIIHVQPAPRQDDPTNIALIISIIAVVILILLLLFQACKCAVQFLRAVQNNNEA